MKPAAKYNPRERYDILHVALRGICRVWDEDDEKLVEAFEALELSLDRLGDELFGRDDLAKQPHVRFITEWQHAYREGRPCPT